VSDIEIVGVDERDSNWEDDRPRFRVYFQRTLGEPGAESRAEERSPSPIGGWTATYDVTGADVVQVIDWAQRQAGPSLVYSIALVRDERDVAIAHPGRGRGLVWLVGIDGNQGALDPREAEMQNRMLARRQSPVIVPAADRMPAGVAEPFTGGGA
jgi:hypothetical protein